MQRLGPIPADDRPARPDDERVVGLARVIRVGGGEVLASSVLERARSAVQGGGRPRALAHGAPDGKKGAAVEKEEHV